jgi:serine/threonine-protein kinase
LYRDTFTTEPKLADNVPAGHRYNAACAAALAGCGKGIDADELDDRQRQQWRRQALDWLRQDLAWWGKTLDSVDAKASAVVQQTMRRWQIDRDLAGLREPDELKKLSEQETKECHAFWNEVATLLRRGDMSR